MPICIFDTSCLDDDSIERYNEGKIIAASGGDMTVSRTMHQAIVFNDYLIRFVLPVCSAMSDRKNPGIAISSAVYIVDVSHLTIKLAWNLRMYVQVFSKLLSTCCPEVIHRIYVCTRILYFSAPPASFYPKSLTSLDQAVNTPPCFGVIWSLSGLVHELLPR